jgi:hypothetical protein
MTARAKEADNGMAEGVSAYFIYDTVLRVRRCYIVVCFDYLYGEIGNLAGLIS